MDLKNSQVMVTGASRGIGWALAKMFAGQGAHLHLVVREPKSDWESQLTSLGAASVSLWAADLSDYQQVQRLEDQLAKKGVALDVLVNNAGQLTGGLLEEQDPEAIHRMLQVNLVNLITLTRLVLPGMLERGRGKIVNNASVSGKMFLPCASTYAASKAGVVAFTESLKQELKGTGVSTLLLITPGVKTDMYDKISDLYGGHLDLSFLRSIPADEWARRVGHAIQRDEETLQPAGSSRFGVSLATHAPGVFERFVASKFQREIRD